MLKTKPKRNNKFVSYRSGELIVADMGCGEAKIAQSVKQKVHSFDLVAQNSLTVACDMSKVMFWTFIKILQK